MGVLQLLAQENFITYSKVIAKKYGVNAAILLGALCSYQNRFEDKEFYKEQDKISDDTCLSRYEIQQALKTLTAAGIVSVTKKGVPAKNWYYISDDKLFKILTTSELKIRQLEVKKLDDINNNSIIKNTKNNNTRDVFIPPTLEEVKEYCFERKNKVDPERFINFYQSKGWFIGKNKMIDWKSCVRKWETDENFDTIVKSPPKSHKRSKDADGYIQHNYTEEQLYGAFVKFDDEDDK